MSSSQYLFTFNYVLVLILFHVVLSELETPSPLSSSIKSSATSQYTISSRNSTQESAAGNVTEEITTNIDDIDNYESATAPNAMKSTSEDLGTVIESDTEESVITTTDSVTLSETQNITNADKNATKSNTTSIPAYEPQSMKDALKDIAYYLRAFKFNEYDRRYETNAEAAPRRYFEHFPRPPLRSLHWEVHKYCEPSFASCVEYLGKRIRRVSLKRTDDTAVVMQEQKWTVTNNSEQIQQIDDECKKLRKSGDIVAEPFEGPLERYQWRATASYFMCFYTMQEELDLKQLFDHCDNFANCLDDDLGPNNKDIRADDTQAYACALYSFCPDPCCPMKHLIKSESCWDSSENPCFSANPPGQRECFVNRSSNIEFRDIVLNRWNVTCRCPAGHEWNSQYGMCVDVDECERGGHNCDTKLQACVNLVGSFRCACIWGHIWNPTENQCAPSKALSLIKLSSKDENEDNKEQSQSFLKKITKIFRKSAAVSLRYDTFLFVSNLFCTLLCLSVLK